MEMRLGLIGDVHAEDDLLCTAIDALGGQKVDRILCTGDVVDGAGNVDRACALLEAHKVTTVRGERDRYIRDDMKRDLPNAHRMTSLAPRSISFVKSLQSMTYLDVPGGRLLLCHGIGETDTASLGAEDEGRKLARNDALLKVLFDASVTVMIHGHSHAPMVRRLERGAGKPALLVVNAGTLHRDEGPGFAVFDAANARVEFYRIDPASQGVSQVSRTVL